MKRKLWVCLILVLCLLPWGTLAEPSDDVDTFFQSEPIAEVQPTAPAAPSAQLMDAEPRKEEQTGWPRTITVTVGGDCTLGCTISQSQRKDGFTSVVEREGLAWPFSGIAHLFAEDDLSLVNLEGPLTDAMDRAEGKEFNFKGPAEYAQILLNGNVEAVNLANNHFHDYKQQGKDDTVTALDEYGIVHSGHGELAVYEAHGVKIGMTGYTFPYTKGKKDISADVKELREMGCQIVIASFHWGNEYEEDFTGDQRRIGRAAIDAGADVVVGHHPHIVQGIEKYKGHYILYSLGNLVFGGNTAPDEKSKDSYLGRLTFTVGEDETVSEPPTLEILPLRLTELKSGTDYRPVPAEGDVAERIIKRIMNRSVNMDQ